MEYYVVIKQFSDNEEIEAFKCTGGQRGAERVERGVNINLNHDEYYTEIEERDE